MHWSPIYTIVLLGFLSSILTALYRKKIKKSDRNTENIQQDQEAREKYLAECKDGETLRTVCRCGNGQYYVLTNQRLIIDTQKECRTILLRSIKKAKCKTLTGSKARRYSDCFTIIIYADQKYRLHRISEQFDGICEEFM